MNKRTFEECDYYEFIQALQQIRPPRENMLVASCRGVLPNHKLELRGVCQIYPNVV
jgi:hypothetical protein